jgi:hypothetical protein
MDVGRMRLVALVLGSGDGRAGEKRETHQQQRDHPLSRV